MFRPAESDVEAAAEPVAPADPEECSPPPLPAVPGGSIRRGYPPLAALDGGRGVLARSAKPQTNVYGRAFWLSYLALTSLMIAVSLMYRYADFVTFLGGTELELGSVVGVGMIGNLLI